MHSLFARRSARVAALVSAAALTALGAVGVAVASAAHHPAQPAAPAPAPVSDRQIPNLTKVEEAIEAYYGDTVVDGEHYASPHSNYARQLRSIEGQLGAYLHARAYGPGHRKKAIVLDVDDTSLLTYNYELESGFAYNPVTNDAYVRAEKMPAVFGMPHVVDWARRHGYAVFYVTGRPEAQRAATAGNLGKAGYSTPDSAHLYLKNTAHPPTYLGCGSTCTTIQYKSGTRAHIEASGYDIVANVGDQYSDLSGGHSERTYKLPNPMYFLP